MGNDGANVCCQTGPNGVELQADGTWGESDENWHRTIVLFLFISSYSSDFAVSAPFVLFIRLCFFAFLILQQKLTSLFLLLILIILPFYHLLHQMAPATKNTLDACSRRRQRRALCPADPVRCRLVGNGYCKHLISPILSVSSTLCMVASCRVLSYRLSFLFVLCVIVCPGFFVDFLIIA